MSKTTIIAVIGTRPNYIKAIPVIQMLKNYYNIYLIDSGQHSSQEMSKNFLNYFNIIPDYTVQNLPVNLAERKEKLFRELMQKFVELGPFSQYVLVFGDTDTTMISSLITHKLNIPIIHIESGLRSGESIMREERNRIIVDHLSHILFCTEQSGVDLLKSEGIEKNVFLVGNTLIDSLCNIKLIDSPRKNEYFLLTLHRPELVDNTSTLYTYLRDLNHLSKRYGKKLLFPVHPRTQNKLGAISIYQKELKNIEFIDPVGYEEFINLLYNSQGVITDSGGVQSEAAWLKKYCFTVRGTTEQPSTIQCGSNILFNKNKKMCDALDNGFHHIKDSTHEIHGISLWDGQASNRILSTLQRLGI